MRGLAIIRLLKRLSRKQILLSLLVIGCITIGLFFLLGNKGNDGQKEMQHIRAKMDKLAILPTDEDPSLATVTDKAKLSDPFLAQSENGDKILLYYKSKRIYVYRPSINKIVNIGPLIVDASAQEVTGTKILVRSGNGSVSVSERLRMQLQNQYQSATIQPLAEAIRQNYPVTIVVDLTEGKKYNLVTNLMQALGAQRGVLPAGEPKPENVDILIITGLDQAQ